MQPNTREYNQACSIRVLTISHSIGRNEKIILSKFYVPMQILNIIYALATRRQYTNVSKNMNNHKHQSIKRYSLLKDKHKLSRMIILGWYTEILVTQYNYCPIRDQVSDKSVQCVTQKFFTLKIGPIGIRSSDQRPTIQHQTTGAQKQQVNQCDVRSINYSNTPS